MYHIPIVRSDNTGLLARMRWISADSPAAQEAAAPCHPLQGTAAAHGDRSHKFLSIMYLLFIYIIPRQHTSMPRITKITGDSVSSTHVSGTSKGVVFLESVAFFPWYRKHPTLILHSSVDNLSSTAMHFHYRTSNRSSKCYQVFKTTDQKYAAVMITPVKTNSPSKLHFCWTQVLAPDPAVPIWDPEEALYRLLLFSEYCSADTIAWVNN